MVAKRLLLTGDTMSAAELQRAGLLSDVFADSEFEEGVRKLALRIAEKSPLALGLIKQLVAESLERGIDEALRLELRTNAAYCLSYDMQEGISAFAERRKPQFLGR